MAPNIENIATELEAELLEFQKQHLESQDWRLIGFLTTLLKINNQLILKDFLASQKILIEPYLRFIEEHVSILWQRVCASSAKYQLNSPEFAIVEQMVSAYSEITENAYRKLVQKLPHYRSKNGSLTDPSVAHSCLRDLKMFQSYLWLSLLEKNMAAIEDELVDLCAKVMPTVGVSWELSKFWSKVLEEEIHSRLTSSQKELLLTYTQGLHQAFIKKRDLFIMPPKYGNEEKNKD